MKTGEGPSGGVVRSSVTDERAIEIFDRIVNSIRVRPTGPIEKSSGLGEPKAPLGTSLLSGETCPQSGEWESYHEPAEGERRRFFAEGELFPKVLLPVPRTLWQTLRGEPASRPFKTTWALRRLPRDEA